MCSTGTVLCLSSFFPLMFHSQVFAGPGRASESAFILEGEGGQLVSDLKGWGE